MSSNIMTRKISIGISISESLLTKIDSTRGDVPRSKFIERALDCVLENSYDLHS